MKNFKLKQKRIATCLVGTALLIGPSSVTAMATEVVDSRMIDKEHKLTKAEWMVEKKAERMANRLSVKLSKLAIG
ncbi:MAG: hypothetical protein KAH20_05315 [Methylococcales bacterium]|nr:hypothetical protein [Methylococcales bacterium]